MRIEKDVVRHNSIAWDKLVEEGNEWTVPVSPEEIAAARKGDWNIYLTESKPVPRDWFPPLPGADVLCLASGGGQQGPIMAAAGAVVTVYDNSAAQLARDRGVAEREGLTLRTIQGDMMDLSAFADSCFDLILHPVSNIFVPDVVPVWREAYRVLRPGGALLAGMVNPVEYCFDPEREEKEGVLVVKHALPYSDAESISEEERRRVIGDDGPFEFSHTLEAQIGGQISAGFVIAGFYESYRREGVVRAFMPSYFATRALKRA